MKTIQKINKIEEQRKNIVQRLLEIDEVLCGSYNTVFRKCGKETCWCKDALQGHAFSRIIWQDQKSNKTKTRAVHENKREWVSQCTANYREMRDLLKSLNALNQELLSAVDLMIKEKSGKTEKKGEFNLSNDN